VNLGKVDWFNVTEELGGIRGFFVPDIADPLEKEQREDICFPVGPVDGTTPKDLCTVPEMGLEVL
jgi:hypothetical protein